MKVLEFFNKGNGGYLDDPLYYFNFKQYESKTSDFYFMLGNMYDAINSGQYDDKRKIILSLEEPNFCTPGHHVDTFNKAELILSICPYTSDTIPNRKFVFFPYNTNILNPFQEKEFDIIYSGHYHGSLIPEFIKTITKFNYRFVNYHSDTLVTNPGCSYRQKLDLYSKSKITLCHNLLFPNRADIPRYRAFPNADKNKAFQLLDYGIMPKIKSRVFEAAFNRSLILCFRDHWNVIEYFFEPDKEFIYFDNIHDLEDKIKYILQHYDFYQDIIDNAYNKAINNYTVDHFVEKYLEPI